MFCFLSTYISRVHLSLINRREVIANANLPSSSYSESVMEMFTLPTLARPQQQRQERLLSSLTNSPSSSLSNSTNQTRLSSTEDQERSSLSNSNNRTRSPANVYLRRSALGPFVFTSHGRTGIRSANHAAGLIGLLQIAGPHQNGIIGTVLQIN